MYGCTVYGVWYPLGDQKMEKAVEEGAKFGVKVEEQTHLHYHARGVELHNWVDWRERVFIYVFVENIFAVDRLSC